MSDPVPEHDDRTGRGYPLPHRENTLDVDADRLRDAVTKIDADMSIVFGDIAVRLSQAEQAIADVQASPPPPPPPPPAIATSINAGLVKGGGNVGIAADGTMTASMAVRLNDNTLNGPVTGFNFANGAGTSFTVTVTNGIATVTANATVTPANPISASAWRLRASAPSYSASSPPYGPYYWAAREIQFFTGRDCTGTLLAPTCTASSFENGYPGARLVDGNQTTDWGAAYPTNTPVTLTFNFPTAVAPASLRYLGSGPAEAPHTPQQIGFEYYNGSAWMLFATLIMPKTVGDWVVFGGLQ